MFVRNVPLDGGAVSSRPDGEPVTDLGGLLDAVGQSMWMYEALVRSRLQETEQEARRQRMIRELTAGRFWRRLARFADRRAELARRGM